MGTINFCFGTNTASTSYTLPMPQLRFIEVQLALFHNDRCIRLQTVSRFLEIIITYIGIQFQNIWLVNFSTYGLYNGDTWELSGVDVRSSVLLWVIISTRVQYFLCLCLNWINHFLSPASLVSVATPELSITDICSKVRWQIYLSRCVL